MKNLKEKQNEYYCKSKALRGLSKDVNGKKSIELRKKQEDYYQKYIFYKNLIKARRKAENGSSTN